MDHFRGRYRIASARLPFWDYTAPGWYFLTMCVRDRAHVLAQVRHGRSILSAVGRVVAAEWSRTAEVRPGVAMDAWVVMPDHLHGIVRLHGPLALDAGNGRDAGDTVRAVDVAGGVGGVSASGGGGDGRDGGACDGGRGRQRGCDGARGCDARVDATTNADVDTDPMAWGDPTARVDATTNADVDVETPRRGVSTTTSIRRPTIRRRTIRPAVPLAPAQARRCWPPGPWARSSGNSRRPAHGACGLTATHGRDGSRDSGTSSSATPPRCNGSAGISSPIPPIGNVPGVSGSLSASHRVGGSCGRAIRPRHPVHRCMPW